MKRPLPPISEHMIVRGTELHPDEPSELTQSKLSRIALDEMSVLVALLSPAGVVLECNRSGLGRTSRREARIIGG